MVIRKINTVFARHGRIIFGLITIVIIIAFMGFMQPGSGFGEVLAVFGKKPAYGEVFGESISRNNIVGKANRDLIISDLIYNMGLNNYPTGKRAESNAFINICLVAAAKRRGITASDKEITNFILERTKFKDPKTKTFDKNLYANYIDNALSKNGFSADELDVAVREHLIQNKLVDELRKSVVVSEDEVHNFYKLLNEKYYSSYALFDKENYLKKVKVTDEEAKNYFASYIQTKEDYVAGKSKILLLEFKYNDKEIKKQVAKELSPEAIEDFYNKNKNLFMDFKEGEKPKLIAFAKVKGKAKKILADRYTKKFTSQKASEFAEAAYDIVGETIKKKQHKAFEDIVAEFEYKAVEIDWFKDDAKKVGNIDEVALINEIIAPGEVPVSNALVGKKAVYVAFVSERIMPRPALFEEIKAKIIDKIKQQKALQLARSQARELVIKLQKMTRAERLKSITKSKNPKFKSAKAFSMMSPPRIQHGNIIVAMARELKNGEAAPSQRTADGAIIVVLKKRVLPHMSAFDAKKKKMLTDIYRRDKTSVAENAFFAWLQTKCKQK